MAPTPQTAGSSSQTTTQQHLLHLHPHPHLLDHHHRRRPRRHLLLQKPQLRHRLPRHLLLNQTFLTLITQRVGSTNALLTALQRAPQLKPVPTGARETGQQKKHATTLALQRAPQLNTQTTGRHLTGSANKSGTSDFHSCKA